MQVSGLQREPADISNVVMAIKCGASDTISGMASNCVIGYVADKLTFNIVRYMSQRKILLLYLGVINLVTFILFGIDKYAAIKGKWRIPVATLLGFSFAGGAIGGIIAMYLFHHKTQKNYFAVGLPMMIVTQLVVLFYCMNAPW